ncbi:MAG: PQQ-dependent sugar dehydrogenase [Deltaproteobacteria bacterium]|nr:PQQ-dependent sugar dehydrogenase [Deltaproteobacteria bacterium]
MFNRFSTPLFWSFSCAAMLLCFTATCGDDSESQGADGGVDGAVDAAVAWDGPALDGSSDSPKDGASPDVIDIVLPHECKPPKLKLARVGTADQPLAVVQPKGDDRFYVAERRGLIKVIKNGQTLAQPFLDMRASIATFQGQGNGQGERGLTNLVFHPNYATNGRFFVFYTRSVNDPFFEGVRREGDIVLAEGHRSAADPELADPTLKQILVVQHDGVNGRNGCCDDAHNGGMLAFGPDGLLYTAVGDGGGGANEYGSKVLGLSTVYRFNVDDLTTPPPGSLTGPQAHPFGWAKGVRNPWRGSFDAKTGDLYFGDVGEATWEEVNYLPKAQLRATGLDFGWGNPGMEGTRVVRYYPYVELGTEPYGVLPVHEYEHPLDPKATRFQSRLARAIVGGAVYRGTQIAGMDGRYFFGDYATSTVWSLLMIDGRAYCQIDHTAELVSPETPIQGLVGFAQGNDNELYLFDIFGNIYRIEKA